MRKTAALVVTVMMACILTECAAAPGGQTAGEEADISVSDSLELLETVWSSYAEDERFAAAGGDYSEENQQMDAPGRFSVGDAQLIDSTLGFPAADIGEIDDAASLMHMMNANTFTCGVYRAKSVDGITALAADIREHIMGRQWVCGFPDKLIIDQVDNYIVVVFGEQELVDTFHGKLKDVYDSAVVISDDVIR